MTKLKNFLRTTGWCAEARERVLQLCEDYALDNVQDALRFARKYPIIVRHALGNHLPPSEVPASGSLHDYLAQVSRTLQYSFNIFTLQAMGDVPFHLIGKRRRDEEEFRQIYEVDGLVSSSQGTNS